MTQGTIIQAKADISSGSLELQISTGGDPTIDLVKNAINNLNIPINNITTEPFYLAYHELDDIINGLHYDFSQLAAFNNPKTDPKRPVIHLTSFDFMDRMQETADAEEIQKSFFFKSLVRRYRHIMESSIWNYYVPILFDQNRILSRLTIESLTYALKEISRNEEAKLYNLMTAVEYAELQGRLIEQSYLTGNHGEGVSPFVFHSEREDDELLRKEIKTEDDTDKTKKDFFFDRKWKMLLVDDCVGDHKMRNHNKGQSNINKLDIITNDISRVINPKKIDIDYAANITEAIAKLFEQQEQYTIILLDYLLDTNSSGNREYGYHLLEITDILSKLLERLTDSKTANINTIINQTLDEQKKLYPYIFYIHKYIEYDPNNSEDPILTVCGIKIPYNEVRKILEKKYFGPNDQLYFMFTSPYWAAIYERLHEEQISLNNKYYQISIGACPTNTPYLFLYNLHDMMRMRYESLSITDEGEARPMCLVEFLEELFCNDSSIHTRCVNRFDDLLRLRTLYNKIKDDNDVLIESLFPDRRYYRNHFWEHLQNLIYLIAFGDIRQVPEMREEYTFISDRLKKAEGKVYSDNPKGHKGPSVLISDYITTLSKL